MISSLINERYKYEKSQMSSIKKSQVGSGMRADKIRTYRFQDDQVIDHISSKTAKAEKVMKGKFHLLW